MARLVPQLFGHVRSNPLGGGQPDGVPGRFGDAEQGRLHLEGGQSPGRVRLVQRLDVIGESALPVGEPAPSAVILRRAGLLGQVKTVTKITRDALAVSRALVNVE